MGRFDALTNLTQDNATQTPSQVALPPPTNEPSAKNNHTDHDKDKNHEIRKSGKPETTLLPDNSDNKPVKYSTLIDPDLLKKIKLHAAERELKDYEVIERALTAYFQKQL